MKGPAEMSTIVRTGWLLVSVLFPMSAYADQVRQEILLWQGTPPGTEAEEAELIVSVVEDFAFWQRCLQFINFFHRDIIGVQADFF